MDPALVVVLAAVGAGVLGALGPQAIAGLPEPSDPPADKRTYADVATIRGSRAVMALLAAVSAALVAWRVDVPELVPAWVVVCGLGSWLGYVDWHTRYLPFVMTTLQYVVVLALVALAALVAGDRAILIGAAIGNVAVYLLYRVLYWMAARFFGGAFGYGDVRLSATLGLALGGLGYGETMVGVYAAFVLGAVFGVVLSALKVVDARGFAFGPYMLAGAVVGAGWGGALYGG